jgi:hypothetical protein
MSKTSEFISKKTKKIMDEGTTKDPKQAVAIAYSYARKEGFAVPKKLVDREAKKKKA